MLAEPQHNAVSLQTLPGGSRCAILGHKRPFLQVCPRSIASAQQFRLSDFFCSLKMRSPSLISIPRVDCWKLQKAPLRLRTARRARLRRSLQDLGYFCSSV